MKKLSLMALIVILSACKGDTIDGEAIHARVVMTPGVSATCVLFEVRDPSSHAVLDKRWLTRADDDLQIAVFRGTLPETVELAARPFLDGTCVGGAEAKTANGVFQSVTATFVKGAVPAPTEIRLEPGADGDTDGYVSTDAGGADCRDADRSVNPSAAETCSVQVDLNCDGKKGCEASTCAVSDCKGPAVALVLGVTGSSVTAGTCSSGSLSVRDSNGTDTRVSGSTPVNLTAPTGGVAFFSDATCTTPASSVTLTGNDASVSFFFQGQIAGTVSLSASATGLTTATQSLQVTPGAGNKLVIVPGPQTLAARACSAPVQFQSKDALNNLSPVTAATQVSLQASPSAGFQFFSDASCSTPVPAGGVTLAQGVSTGSFHFKGTQAGTVNVTLTATNFTGAQQTETITAGPPSVMVFTGPGTAAAGECSGLVTVTLKDADNNTATAPAGGANISLTPNGGPLTFSTSPTCTGTTTTVAIAAGASTATFRYRGTQVGAFSIGGSFGALTSTPLPVTIAPGAPTALVLTPGPQTLTAGNCSSQVTATLRDAFGNAAPVSSDTQVTLSANPPGGFQFFTDSGCATPAVTSVSISTGASAAGFYFKGIVSGTVAMTATQGSLTASQNATISPAAPTVLAFSPPALLVAAGDCTAVTLLSNDNFGNRSNVSGNQVITLAPGANMIFSTASNCSTTATSVTINGGQSSVSFFTRATLVGNVSGTASRTGFNPATLSLTVSPGAPTKLAFTTSPQTLEINTCSAVTTVQVRDSSNNPSPVTSDTTVNLTASPSGNITFYRNNDCTGATTSITIASGQTNGSFYFKDTVAENVTITASNGSLTSATQDESITSPQPTALVFTTASQTRTAGACSGLVTVQAQVGGLPTTVATNTLVDLAAAPSAGFSFYSSGNCSGPAVTQVTIGTGQSSVNFTFRSNTAGTIGLTASNPSIPTPAFQTATITAAAPTKLVFSTLPLTTVAGTCSQPVTVQSRDNFDNLSAVTADKTIALSVTGTPADTNFKFYSDAACTNEINGGSPLVLANGQSSVTFRYQGQKARSVDLSASTSGLTATGPQAHTLTAAAASKVVFTSTSPAQLLASTCAARTLERQDAFSNPAAGVSTLDVALSASASAEFFSDAGCTTPVAQVTIAAGASTADFYFKGLSGGINATAPLTLTATPSGLTAATQLETIIPTVRTGSCTMAANLKVFNCPITPALLDANKTFLVFQATTQNQTSDLANVRCFLQTANSPVDVQCERGGNGGANTVSVRWAVAEFPTGVSVLRGALPCGGDVTTATINPGVVPERAFSLFSSEKDTANQRQTIPRLTELKSSVLGEIRKVPGTGCGGGAETNSLQLVDYTGAVVQRGLASIGTLAASTTADLTSTAALNRSILLYSYIFDSTTTKICDRLVRGEITNGGTKVTFTRGSGDTSANCTTPLINSISYETVTFPVGTTVQQVTRSLLAGGASTNVSISPVDPSRTIVIGGGQWASGQVHGESKFAGGEDISEGRAQAYLTDGSTLTLSRETSGDGATFTVYVVQLKP